MVNQYTNVFVCEPIKLKKLKKNKINKKIMCVTFGPIIYTHFVI